MKYWKRLTKEQQNTRILQALKKTVDFESDISLGYPASKLDDKVFNTDITFLKDAPLLQAFIKNPNNIGCHTFGESEHAFGGTQQIEREVLQVLAEDIFNCKQDQYDGYIATGGTEANIEAMWIYRNLFKKEYQAKQDEIVILCSEDSHYSMPKGANLLDLDIAFIPVDFETRAILEEALQSIVKKQKEKGKKYFIVVSNLATTMFGSVDDPNVYAKVLQEHQVAFRMHLDGAFGGFIYPFKANSSKDTDKIDFSNPNISSITIDAHKMLQAPYGTGIFLCRKGLITYAATKEAQYVNGTDVTVSGSRSGTNAIAVWMLLFSYGYYGWFEKISILLMRTDWFCKQLDALDIKYYRNPRMNIITIHAAYIPESIAEKYELVPDTHDGNPKWYKVVIMDHVELDDLITFLDALKEA
ncbi:MAG TPA: aspartate aminotransferase family protein [Flavobacteriia bacterium]|nr:aspartate aminotransferase family protein [Flavobacteriia bacterium]